MGTYAFTVPIVPGKVEEWKAFTKELSGGKKSDYQASRKRAGIVRETVFLQKTPMGDFVVVVLEAQGDAAVAMAKVFASSDPFDRWFAERVKHLHGISAAELAGMPPNTMHYDWRA